MIMRSLVLVLLSVCFAGAVAASEKNFEIASTFDTVPMKYFDGVKEECYKNHVPMSVGSNYIGIPLRPKDPSSFGRPKHPEIGEYVGYFIAPIGKDCGGWALYEVMWRKR